MLVITASGDFIVKACVLHFYIFHQKAAFKTYEKSFSLYRKSWFCSQHAQGFVVSSSPFWSPVFRCSLYM